MADGATTGGEDLRKHLDLIQAVVTRMSGASSVAKGWSLTIATAAYGYGVTKHAVTVVLLGVGAVLLFAALDARYLREERKYRLLFDAARRGEVELYEMNAARYCGSLTVSETSSIGWGSVLRSWSIRDFYGLIVLAGILLTIVTVCVSLHR
jgi:hypothetical protein